MQNKSDLEKEIKYLDINSIIPFSRNNRVHGQKQIDLICNSINEFGFNQPIVVDENNIILVGHGRLEAAKKLKLKQVPILIKKDLTESQKKAYRILDNKLQNDSTWDFDNLKLELDALQDLDFDLNAWGLDALLPEDTSENEVSEDDFDPSIETESFIKLGDLIEIGSHKVLCGDALTDQKNLLNGVKVQIVFTDPPYGIGGYDGRAERHEAVKGDSDKDFIKFYKCIPNAPEKYIWGDYQVIPLLEELPKDIIIWAKNNFGLGRGYRGQYEMCLYYGNFTESDSDLWQIPKDTKYTHPTQKPIALAARALKNSSKKGDVVLDLYLGSGSTLIACEQLERVCYGMELDPKYCQAIINRYKKYCEDNNKPFICKINGESFSG